MPNGHTPVGTGPNEPVNTAQGNWAQLLQKLGPILMQMSQRGQPQGGGMPPVPGTAPQMPPPPTLGSPSGGLDIKADPRASSYLPPPAAQRPISEPSGYQPYQGGYRLTPQNQGVYDAVQGFSGFLQKWVQKKEQAQSSEAANAAQALMQAIESGDYMSADHIFHENEKLFNKVYKGWMQKAKESQKQEKPDPDVQGVESGLQQHLLHGKKSNYMIPRAGPAMQAAQQQASSLAQALQQQPSLGIPGGAITPAEQAKLQGEFYKVYGEMQKSQTEYQIKQTDLQKAQLEVEAAKTKGEVEQESARTAAAKASSEVAIAASNLDIKKTQLLIENARLNRTIQTGKNAKIPASIQKQFSALGQASQLVKSVDSKKGFAPNEFMSLQTLLTTAGLPTYSKSLTTSWLRGHLMPGTQYADPSAISESLDRQKQALLGAFPGLEPKEEPDKDSDTDPDSGPDDDPLGYFSK